ncbi:MAG: hypothetical protein AB7I48_06410 [Planctomycetaceae bacterium]
MTRQILCLGSLAVLAVALGCAKQSAPKARTAEHEPSAEGRKYLLGTEPEGAQDLIAARERTENDQEVTVIGRIGGRVDPWIEGRAAFSLVDRSLAACTDIPGDNCPTPWDYCCVTDKLPAATALIKFVDADGQLIGTDARELLGLHELQTVVVQGKAQRDDAGNMTILASALFAHPGDMGQYPRGETAEHGHDHGHHHDHGHDDADQGPVHDGTQSTGAGDVPPAAAEVEN